MNDISGNWVGKIEGTNIGNVYVEITQNADSVSGTARLNDPTFGTSSYSFTGKVNSSDFHLEMKPSAETLNESKKGQFLVNQQPVVIDAPVVSYGDIRVDGQINADNTLKGKWISSIGTGGTLCLWQNSHENVKTTQEALKKQAFVMMPISDKEPELEDTLAAITRAFKSLEIECVRVDQIEHSGRITDLILEYINESQYLICDITKERPNVYYELGYAHGKGKETILVAKEGTTLHFDIKDYNIILYKSYSDLEQRLSQRVKAKL